MLLAFMKKLLQSTSVLLAWLSALPALMVRRVQRVPLLLLQTELLLLPQLVVSIFFDYNYI